VKTYYVTIEHQRTRKLVLSTIIEPTCLIDWMNDSKASRVNTSTILLPV
jgi:hypothetical protein